MYDVIPDPADLFLLHDRRKSIEEIIQEKDDEMNYWEERRCEWDDYLPDRKTQ